MIFHKLLKLILISFFVSLSSLSIIGSESVVGSSLSKKNNENIINKILDLKIDSTINPATYHYLKAAYEKASNEKFDAILVRLNTPGGLVSTTKKILTLIGESDLPFIVWVGPEGASATSAGAIISSGAHLLVMSEGTNIGAATPVGLGKDIEKGETSDLRKKAVNDLVALVKGLANSKGRNEEAFAKMISEASSFNSKDALKKNIIDGIVNSQEQLLSVLYSKKIHLKGRDLSLSKGSGTFIKFEMDISKRVLDILANPSLAYILFLLGVALLYLELQAPGGFIAGSVGGILLVLSGISFQVLPLNFGAMGLVLLSLVLFVLEFYITSYGILSVAALASLSLGSLFLFHDENAYFAVSKVAIFSGVAAITVFVLWIAYIFAKDLRSSDKSDDFSLEGKSAEIKNLIEQNGDDFLYYVYLNGEYWKARSKSELELGQLATVYNYKMGEKILNIK